MEEWKFIDRDSEIFKDPAAALNLTTERWLLQPFPDGLVASTGSWNASDDRIRDDFQLQLDLDVLYPCRGSLCSSKRRCQSVDDRCFVPVEGIGATTVGPAHSGIVALTHGVVFLLVIIITLAVVMGCFSSKPFQDDDSASTVRPVPTHTYPIRQPARPSVLEQDHQLAQYYARPPREPAQRPVEVDWVCPAPGSEAEKSRHIARLTTLLRDMYALDLEAWSMEGVAQREADKKELLRVRTEAERIFGEVAYVVGQWQGAAAERRTGAWTAEEARVIDAIFAAVSEHLPEPVRGGGR